MTTPFSVSPAAMHSVQPWPDEHTVRLLRKTRARRRRRRAQRVLTRA